MNENPDMENTMQWYAMRDLKRRNAKLPAYKMFEGMGMCTG